MTWQRCMKALASGLAVIGSIRMLVFVSGNSWRE